VTEKFLAIINPAAGAGAAASAWVQRLIACGYGNRDRDGAKLAPPARPLALRARPMRADSKFLAVGAMDFL